MKKLFMLFLPMLLSGCSYYHDIIERMHTNTQVWQCDGKPLRVKLNDQRQEISVELNDEPLILKRGLSASGERYSDGIYVFWSQGDKATVYKRDHIVLDNCQRVLQR